VVGELAVTFRTSVRLDAATRQWLDAEAHERKIGLSTFLRELAVKKVGEANKKRAQLQTTPGRVGNSEAEDP
jgi:hypothetical protein